HLIDNLGTLVILGLTIFTYCLLLLTISVPLFVAAVVIFGLLSLVQQRIVARIGRYSHHLSTIGAELSKRIVESIQALRVLHTFHRQAEAAAAASEELRGILHTTRKIFVLIAFVGPLAETVMVTAV